MWDQPEELRQTMVDNAPTFMETMDDPRWADLDVGHCRDGPCRSS
jgi:hypothetical protein